jgi:acyl carrier protein
MKETIAADVHKFILETFLLGDETRLTDTASFIEQGLIDSTGILELVGFIEEHYGIRVEDSELVPENLDSVEQIATYVVSKVQVIPTTNAVISQAASAQ